MTTLQVAAESWAEELKDWYDIPVTVEEILKAINLLRNETAFDGRPRLDLGFRNPQERDIGWHTDLDTQDRETLTYAIECNRTGKPYV